MNLSGKFYAVEARAPNVGIGILGNQSGPLPWLVVWERAGSQASAVTQMNTETLLTSYRAANPNARRLLKRLLEQRWDEPRVGEDGVG